MSRLFKIYVFAYLMLQPVIGLFVYYFKIVFAKNINKSLTVIGLLLFLVFGLKHFLIKRSLFSAILFFVFFTTPFYIIVYNLVNYSVDYTALVSQFTGSLLFISFFMVGYHKWDIYGFFKQYEDYLKYILLIDACVIIIFTVNPFGFSFYPSFQSSFLLPIFCFLMMRNKRLLAILCFALIIMHQKRAVVVVAILLCLLYLFIATPVRYKLVYVFAMISIVIGGSVYISQIDVSQSPLLKRYVLAFETILLFDLSNTKDMDTSLLEKIMEVQVALDLKKDWVHKIFGNGYGWSFQLPTFEGGYVNRRYMHITPFYIYITHGFIGVGLYVLLFFKSLFNLVKKNQANTYYFLMIVATILESFSTLNLFTQFLFGWIIGSMFISKNDSVE